MAILASVLSAHMSLSRRVTSEGLERGLTGVRWAFGLAVGLAMVAAVFALFIRDEDASATMAARAR